MLILKATKSMFFNSQNHLNCRFVTSQTYKDLLARAGGVGSGGAGGAAGTSGTHSKSGAGKST